MCRPAIGEVVPRGALDAVGELLVPDAVLRLLAAGVGLLAVAVAEAGIDPQRDPGEPARPGPAAHRFAVLVDHVGRAAVDGDVLARRPARAFRGRRCRRCRRSPGARRRQVDAAGLEPGGERAVDFAGAHGVDDAAVAADEVEDREIRVRLLGEPHRVERGEVGDALGDHRGVVDEQRRAEALGEIGDGLAGEGVNQRGKRNVGRGHGRFSDGEVDGTDEARSRGSAESSACHAPQLRPRYRPAVHKKRPPTAAAIGGLRIAQTRGSSLELTAPPRREPVRPQARPQLPAPSAARMACIMPTWRSPGARLAPARSAPAGRSRSAGRRCGRGPCLAALASTCGDHLDLGPACRPLGDAFDGVEDLAQRTRSTSMGIVACPGAAARVVDHLLERVAGVATPREVRRTAAPMPTTMSSLSPNSWPWLRSSS